MDHIVYVVCYGLRYFEYFRRNLKPEYRPFVRQFRPVTTTRQLRGATKTKITRTGPEWREARPHDWDEIMAIADLAGHEWVSESEYVIDRMAERAG